MASMMHFQIPQRKWFVAFLHSIPDQICCRFRLDREQEFLHVFERSRRFDEARLDREHVHAMTGEAVS